MCNYIAFRLVFKKIYAADEKIYATAGPTGPAKYQLCLKQGQQYLVADVSDNCANKYLKKKSRNLSGQVDIRQSPFTTDTDLDR